MSKAAIKRVLRSFEGIHVNEVTSVRSRVEATLHVSEEDRIPDGARVTDREDLDDGWIRVDVRF